jgi:hypothetical protein
MRWTLEVGPKGNSIWAEGSVSKLPGTSTVVRGEDGKTTRARVVNAVLLQDGRKLRLTLETEIPVAAVDVADAAFLISDQVLAQPKPRGLVHVEVVSGPGEKSS